jgi:DNA-directed RNA polymerase subunit F
MDTTKPTIIEEKEIPMFELKEELTKIKKREEEPNYRVQKTEEYVNTFVSLKPKQAKELVEKLQKLNIPRMNDKIISKIVDILPRTVDELKVILQGYTITVNNDNIKKIVNTVNEFLPDKEK